MTTHNTFNLECFYLNTMNKISSSINDGLIQLSIKSNTHEAICPACKKSHQAITVLITGKYKTYPYLGKKLSLI